MEKVYISAPFRGLTTFIEGREYGVLEHEEYKNFLENVEQTIIKLGFKVSLPHRDEGEWGSIYIEPDDITKICCRLIDDSQLLVVFPGNSRGVHFEVGYATAFKKKILILLSQEENESTLIKGISKITTMNLFRYKSKDEALKIIENELIRL